MLRGLIRGLKDIVYPKTCLACKDKLINRQEEDFICGGCAGKIKRNLPPFCLRCGRHLDNKHFTKNICVSCIKKSLHFDRAFSPCSYEGIIQKLIHEFKYKNKDYLGKSLSRLMIEFIREYDLPPIKHLDLIIPVPLHKSRLREREFNQAEVLSRHLAQEFDKTLLNDNLIRTRATRTQTELDKEERLSNVENSFALKESHAVKGKNILLVDDVLTTASTASCAAETLKESGANIVFVLTLAN